MANQLFSTDILKETLGPEFDTLKNCTINAGEAFMAGKITNIAFDATQISGVQGATQLAAAGLGAYGTVSSLFGSGEGNIKNIATTLSQEIISKVTQIVTSEITNVVAEYSLKHVNAITNFPMNVQQTAMNYFNENKKSIGDVLKELNEDVEERLKKEMEAKNEKNKKSFIDKMQNTVSEVNDKVTKFSKEALEKIALVTSYVENGPEWISDKVDKEIKNVTSAVKKEVDVQWEKDKKLYDEQIKKYGEQVGGEMVEQYDKKLEQAQKKAKEMLDKQKSATFIKAKMTVIKVKLQLMSKIGISI